MRPQALGLGPQEAPIPGAAFVIPGPEARGPRPVRRVAS